MSAAAMRCWVYRGGRTGNTYLYVPGPQAFERVPEALLRALGHLELALELELEPGRRLARAEASEILRSLRGRGYYLQLPAVDTPRDTPLQ